MNLGHKTQSRKALGIKNIIGSQLGQKVASVVIPHALSAVAHTADGIIHNYSNSADVAKEPIKGVPLKTKSMSKPSSIEKHRRSRSESDAHKYA